MRGYTINFALILLHLLLPLPAGEGGIYLWRASLHTYPFSHTCQR
jgi:hypothetical protein